MLLCALKNRKPSLRNSLNIRKGSKANVWISANGSMKMCFNMPNERLCLLTSVKVLHQLKVANVEQLQVSENVVKYHRKSCMMLCGSAITSTAATQRITSRSWNAVFFIVVNDLITGSFISCPTVKSSQKWTESKWWRIRSRSIPSDLPVVGLNSATRFHPSVFEWMKKSQPSGFENWPLESNLWHFVPFNLCKNVSARKAMSSVSKISAPTRGVRETQTLTISTYRQRFMAIRFTDNQRIRWPTEPALTVSSPLCTRMKIERSEIKHEWKPFLMATGKQRDLLT